MIVEVRMCHIPGKMLAVFVYANEFNVYENDKFKRETFYKFDVLVLVVIILQTIETLLIHKTSKKGVAKRNFRGLCDKKKIAP